MAHNNWGFFCADDQSGSTTRVVGYWLGSVHVPSHKSFKAKARVYVIAANRADAIPWKARVAMTKILYTARNQSPARQSRARP